MAVTEESKKQNFSSGCKHHAWMADLDTETSLLFWEDWRTHWEKRVVTKAAWWRGAAIPIFYRIILPVFIYTYFYSNICFSSGFNCLGQKQKKPFSSVKKQRNWGCWERLIEHCTLVRSRLAQLRRGERKINHFKFYIFVAFCYKFQGLFSLR